MLEHSGPDVKFVNKYCPSSSSSSSASSSSSSSAREMKILATLRGSLSRKYPQKNGEVLSAQYGINLLLVGLALMLALAYQGPTVTEETVLAFLTTLMLMQVLWMICYVARLERKRNEPPERDADAATSWIRGTQLRFTCIQIQIINSNKSHRKTDRQTGRCGCLKSNP